MVPGWSRKSAKQGGTWPSFPRAENLSAPRVDKLWTVETINDAGFHTEYLVTGPRTNVMHGDGGFPQEVGDVF